MLLVTFACIALSLASFSSATPFRRRADNVTVSEKDCAAATILAIGIAMNIVDQRNEQASLALVKAALSTTPVDMTAFMAAKSALLTFVNNGITIRQMNQAIMPPGNAATAGLQTVSMAQIAELDLAQGLTGNPTVDLKAVETLEKDFAGGIEQNMKNQAAATTGCQSPAGGAAAKPSRRKKR